MLVCVLVKLIVLVYIPVQIRSYTHVNLQDVATVHVLIGTTPSTIQHNLETVMSALVHLDATQTTQDVMKVHIVLITNALVRYHNVKEKIHGIGAGHHIPHILHLED